MYSLGYDRGVSTTASTQLRKIRKRFIDWTKLMPACRKKGTGIHLFAAVQQATAFSSASRRYRLRNSPRPRLLPFERIQYSGCLVSREHEYFKNGLLFDYEPALSGSSHVLNWNGSHRFKKAVYYTREDNRQWVKLFLECSMWFFLEGDRIWSRTWECLSGLRTSSVSRRGQPRETKRNLGRKHLLQHLRCNDASGSLLPKLSPDRSFWFTTSKLRKNTYSIARAHLHAEKRTCISATEK